MLQGRTLALRSPSVNIEAGHEQAELKTWVKTCAWNLKPGFSSFDDIQESTAKAGFSSLIFSILKKRKKKFVKQCSDSTLLTRSLRYAFSRCITLLFYTECSETLLTWSCMSTVSTFLIIWKFDPLNWSGLFVYPQAFTVIYFEHIALKYLLMLSEAEHPWHFWDLNILNFSNHCFPNQGIKRHLMKII